MHIVYMHELSLTQTPTRSISDDPGFARPDIGRLFLLCRCSVRLYALRGTWVLSLLFWYSCIFLFLLLFFDSGILPLASISFLTSFEIMCSLYMYYCSDRWFLWFRFIACSGYFRLSVYTWGIFLAYTRRRLSSRLCFSVFWEAGRDKLVGS